jgi:hypothetical protein
VQPKTRGTLSLELAAVARDMENPGIYRYKGSIIPDNQKDFKKNEIKPWQSQEWCIPTRGESDFVAAMEDVLDVYSRKYDKKRALVCMDEIPRQLGLLFQPRQGNLNDTIRNTFAMGHALYSCLQPRLRNGGGLR